MTRPVPGFADLGAGARGETRVGGHRPSRRPASAATGTIGSPGVGERSGQHRSKRRRASAHCDGAESGQKRCYTQRRHHD
jgi:hypothetical protein